MSDLPDWIPPMLATLYKKEPFDDEEWLFEKKLDGVRCLAYFDGTSLRLMTRNQNRVNEEYPELVEEVAKLSKKPFIVDGEIVFKKGRMGSFGKMQKRIGVKHPSEELQREYPLSYYLFDLLFFDGQELSEKPLTERKKLLKKLKFSKKVLYTPHENTEGISFMKKMRKEDYEGMIAKQKKSCYLSSRSKKWLKLKCQNRQELVIGGYTDPQGERKGFGALLVGFYSEGKLAYAGKVGTGYSDKELLELHDQFKEEERKSSPFDKHSPQEEGIHWMKPKFVAEIKFTEWTSQDKLRHPVFIGLRRDKDPQEVVKEG